MPFEEARTYNDTWAQERIPSFLIQHPWIYAKVCDWLDPSWFRAPEVRGILAAMRQYRQRTGATPTAKQALGELAATSEKNAAQRWTRCQEITTLLAPEDAPVILADLKSILKTSVTQAITLSEEFVEAMSAGDHNALRLAFAEIDKVVRLATDLERTSPEICFFDEVPTPDPKDIVPAPWPEFNEVMGGLYPGDVVGLAGSTGDGKSMVLSWITSTYAQAGEPVMYVNFENNPHKMRIGVAAAAADRNLPADQANEILANLPARPLHWRPRQSFMTVGDFVKRVEEYEAALGQRIRVIIIDPLHKLKDPDLIKEHGSVWMAQDAVLREIQVWMEDTKRVGFFTVQINRPGGEKAKKGQERSGADLAGSYGIWQEVQHGLILERGDEAPRLVVDKSRDDGGAIKGKAFLYEYEAGSKGESARGWLRYKGLLDGGEIKREAREKKIDQLANKIIFGALDGLVTDERESVGARDEENPYFGKTGMLKSDWNKLFANAGDSNYALHTLRERGLILECGKVRFAGVQKTWVVFSTNGAAQHDNS